MGSQNADSGQLKGTTVERLIDQTWARIERVVGWREEILVKAFWIIALAYAAVVASVCVVGLTLAALAAF